ncbi:PEP-CTERM sorting domain-containing protein [Rhodopirellula bahusiensis]|uniref:PEP-CTERM sorting domain-containing protein n=1 Tax=Rhodopirellula bahusiensis TaxID=2014065 RepID=UPI0032639389
MKFFLAAVPLLALLFGNSVSAAVLGAGNLIVTDSASNSVREFTFGGSLVQSFTLTPPDGSSETLRGLKVDANGNLQVFNGTFSPVLSTIDVTTGTQTDRSGNFSTVNALGYGKVAAVGDSLLVSDSFTVGSPDGGILRFNGTTTDRFIANFTPTDMTIGQDGLLTVLGTTGNAAASNPTQVRVYNPTTAELISEFRLPNALLGNTIRGLVADNSGNYYAHEIGDEIFQIDSSGNLLASLDVTDIIGESLIDIDIDPLGNIALGTSRGNVILTDTSFTNPISFEASTSTDINRGIYVGFTSRVTAVPEPATAGLLVLASGLAMHRQRRRKRSRVENN